MGIRWGKEIANMIDQATNGCGRDQAINESEMPEKCLVHEALLTRDRDWSKYIVVFTHKIYYSIPYDVVAFGTHTHIISEDQLFHSVFKQAMVPRNGSVRFRRVPP